MGALHLARRTTVSVGRLAGPPHRLVLKLLIRRGVVCRFRLSAGEFADRITARAAARSPGEPVARYARRLCLDDLYLSMSCLEDDPGAWQECADRHFSFIRDFARRFLSEASAHDVADQVIADLWSRRRLARYEGLSTLRTWLGAVVAHAAINAGKSERRRLHLDGLLRDCDEHAGHRVLPATPLSVEDEQLHRELGRILHRSLAGLTAEDRLLLLLYYEQDLTLEAMSGVLHLSKATLSRRLDRARARLRGEVDRQAGERFGGSLRGLDLSRVSFDLQDALEVRENRVRGV